MNNNNYVKVVGKLISNGQSCVLNGNHALIIRVLLDENNTINLYVPTCNHYLFYGEKNSIFTFLGHIENNYGQKIVIDEYSKVIEN